MHTFNTQQPLRNELVTALPLKESDFDRLYAVACDPLIWEQHPNKDRYRADVFQTFFEGAIASGGAYLVLDNLSNTVIGSSRFYEADEATGTIAIGYTFLARSHWGKGYNPALKKLMLAHAFQAFQAVIFHIGAFNIRSQKAMEKLGGIKTGELKMPYYGEPERLNFIYTIRKEDLPGQSPETVLTAL